MEIRVLRTFNLIVAFLLELAVLAAYGCVSVIVSGSGAVRYGVALAIIAAVVVSWAVFAAPLAEHRLRTPWLYSFKALIFGGAAAILLRAHWIHLAICFVGIAMCSLALEASSSKRELN